MRVSELKTIANQYADLYIKDEALFFAVLDAEKERYNAREWFAVIQLAQVYVNVMCGLTSRAEGIREQEHMTARAKAYVRFC